MLDRDTADQDEQDAAFPCWAILEVMGHHRLAGKISEAELFGGVLLRLDIPGDSGMVATQFYGASAIYRITPTSETTARKVAALGRPEPVTAWELAPPFGTDADNEPENEEGEDEPPFG